MERDNRNASALQGHISDCSRLFLVLAHVLGILLFFTSVAFSADTFSIRGVVRNPQGNPIQGAKVSVVGSSRRTDSCITNKDGSYEIPNLRAPSMSLRISAKGYFSRTILTRLRKGIDRDFCLFAETDSTPWLGIEVDEVLNATESPGSSRVVQIVSVEPQSPAAIANIGVSDEITMYDDVKVDSELTFFRLVSNSRIGRRVPIVLRRDGKEINMSVVVGRRKTQPETEEERNAKARKSTHKPGKLIPYRQSAIAIGKDIGRSDGKSYVMESPGAVDVRIDISDAGTYRIEVIAFGGSQSGTFPRWSLLLDKRHLKSFATQSSYFHIYNVSTTMAPGKHTVRVEWKGRASEAKKDERTLHLYGLRVLKTVGAKTTEFSKFSADEFIREHEQRNDLIWKKQDAEDKQLTWIALRNNFLVLLYEGAPGPIDFSAFLNSLPHPQINVTKIIFLPEAVWTGTDHGLFRFDRHLRKWSQWATDAKHIDTHVTGLVLVGTTIEVRYRLQNGKTREATFSINDRKWLTE